jgi:divalent metal cation (Fe/Co/Zn/Cd) transporter
MSAILGGLIRSQIDHRNDIVVNVFGLIMSIVGTKLVWWLDPFGAICIGLLIMVSWVSTAFEHVWLLVGKGAPREFISKVIYMTLTHDSQILKVDTVSEKTSKFLPILTCFSAEHIMLEKNFTLS